MADNNPLRGALLRIFAQSGRQAFGHITDILFHRHPARSLNRQPLGNIIEPVLHEILPHTRISQGWLPGAAHIDYPVVRQPAVLMIVEASGDLAIMQRLIEQTWRNRRYANVEVALFASPDLPQDVAAYLQEVDATAPEGLAIFITPPGMERSARTQAAILNSSAELILIVRPDIAPADPLWIEQLAGHALRPEIGSVAPRLVDRNGCLHGNALLLGMHGFAVGMGHGESFSAPGHFGRLLTPQNPSALSPDVVMFARTALESAGGFDTGLGLTAAMIDLSLRFRHAGFDNLWTPM